MTHINSISGAIGDAAFHVHRTPGPGWLESGQELVLARELGKRGRRVERQRPVPIEFEGTRFEEGFRADLTVEGCVIVGLKSVQVLSRMHSKQLLTFLRLLDYRPALLITFGAPLIKDGIGCIVNRL